ncbi:hemocyte defensin Cg-Defh1-like [Crassostrea virginica]
MEKFALFTVGLVLLVSGDVVLAGFGCPLNQYQCNEHCQQTGCAAGYCGGFLKLRCTCARCNGKTSTTRAVDYTPMENVFTTTPHY